MTVDFSQRLKDTEQEQVRLCEKLHKPPLRYAGWQLDLPHLVGGLHCSRELAAILGSHIRILLRF